MPPWCSKKPLLRDEAPAVRRSAWRIVSYCALPLAPAVYDAALGDEDPGVHDAALTAAAWNGYAGWLARMWLGNRWY